jgi:hypothetical protein
MGDRERRESDPLILTPLRARHDSSERIAAWDIVPPADDETCRWKSIDGRWVAVTIGRDAELGQVIVTSSDGRRHVVDNYEDALTTARLWRAAA